MKDDGKRIVKIVLIMLLLYSVQELAFPGLENSGIMIGLATIIVQNAER